MQVVGWLGLGMELGCLREECRPPNGAPERMVLMRARPRSITAKTRFNARIVAENRFDRSAMQHDASRACVRLDRTGHGASAGAASCVENYREQERLGAVAKARAAESTCRRPFFTSASTSFAASSA